MTNKKRYRMTDELVDAFGKFLDYNPIYRLEDVKEGIEEYLSFCYKNECFKCPFFENDKEHCFIQWLNTEVEK